MRLYSFYGWVLGFAWLICLGACGSDRCTYHPSSSDNYSALDCSPELSTTFRLGVNPGYYPKNKDYAQGTLWSDIDLASKIRDTGFTTFRPALFSSILSYYGQDVKRTEYDHYRSIGMSDTVMFLSGGWEVAGDPAGDRATEDYGCAEASKGFRGMYLPIWIGDEVNTDNRYAAYVDQILQGYGDRVKVLEVWNEPDLPTNDLLAHRYDYGGSLQADGWWVRDPDPCELLNLYAPIETYIRMLRITYELVRKYNREQGRGLLIATGGIGYPSFLKHLLEKSDNPDGGKITSMYPMKGGAYFDLLSYHSYPFFMNYEIDRTKGLNVVVARNGAKAYARHSDHLKDHPVFLMEDFDRILAENGFDGRTYPKKKMIVTEIGMHDAAWGIGDVDYSSSVDLQVNTMIKSLVAMLRAGISQVHLYKFGSHHTPASTIPRDLWGELEGGLWSSFGIYDDLTVKGPSQARLTVLGSAVKLWLRELSGFHYDAEATEALRLPTSMDGAVFSRGIFETKIILWAKSTRDKSERADVTVHVSTSTFSHPPVATTFTGDPIWIRNEEIRLTSSAPILIR